MIHTSDRCYICLEDAGEFAMDPHPCECKGTNNIHKECLQSILQRTTICSICRKEYNLHYRRTDDGYTISTVKGELIKYRRNKRGNYDGLFHRTDKYGMTTIVTYVNGVREGQQIITYADGSLRLRCNYKQNKKDGLLETWHPSGQLSMRCYQVNGKLHGLYESWDIHGVRKESYMNQNGKMDGIYESWYDNGNPELKIYYTGGTENGVYESYNYDGQILCKCTYQDGHLVGLYQQWYENGQLREESTYSTDGHRNGISTMYHDNGQVMSRAMYVDGSLEGPDNRWYKSGVMYVQSFCIKGVDVGEWKKWDSDGKLIEHYRLNDTGEVVEKIVDLPEEDTGMEDIPSNIHMSDSGVLETDYTTGPEYEEIAAYFYQRSLERRILHSDEEEEKEEDD